MLTFFRPSPKHRRLFKGELPRILDRSACQVLALVANALEFERAVKVQACPAGDLHAIASDCALHVSSASMQLMRTQLVLTQPPGPIWSSWAGSRARGGVLID